jgi:hypothetical protein
LEVSLEVPLQMVASTKAVCSTGENMNCKKCNDSGVIETGNNDIPCSCPMGDKALFNHAGVSGEVTGAEIKRHFQNGSPEPIETGRDPISALSLPGRR